MSNLKVILSHLGILNMFKLPLQIAISVFLCVSNAADLFAMFSLDEDHSEQKTSNATLATISYKILPNLPDDMGAPIIQQAAFQQCLDNELPVNLALVCKEWFKTIENQMQTGQPCFKAWYGIFGHEGIYETFLNGVLIYRSHGLLHYGSDINEKMSKIYISELKDNSPEGTSYKLLKNKPLEGTFDLSICGDARKYFAISTGYRKWINPDNEGKAEIWIAPRFLIEKKIETSASHFSGIMKSWKENVAPIGVFVTLSGEAIEHFDYCTSKDLGYISKMNLHEIATWRLPHAPSCVSTDYHKYCKVHSWGFLNERSHVFMFIFGSKIRIIDNWFPCFLDVDLLVINALGKSQNQE